MVVKFSVYLNRRVFVMFFFIYCHLLNEDFVTFKIVIITNFVVVSSVGIKRFDCIMKIRVRMSIRFILLPHHIGRVR